MARYPLLFLVFLMFLCSGADTASALDGRTRPLAAAAFTAAKRQRWDDAASFARQTGDQMIIDSVEWMELTRSSQIPEFQRITRFLSNNKDWPERELLLRRAEIALLSGNFNGRVLVDWFAANPPRTAYGTFKYMQMSGKNVQKDTVNATWINGDFTLPEEEQFLELYGGLLTSQVTAERVDRLLWENKIPTAKRYLSRLPAPYQALFNARIALKNDTKSAPALVARVPASLASTEGFLFDRAAWRAGRKMYDGLGELILQAPKQSAYAAKWWPYRAIAIREAIADRNYALAERLAATPGTIDRVEMAEALWLRGWIALSFRGHPQAAFDDFKSIYDTSQYPISRARGAYWASLAAKKLNNTKVAQEWMYAAAKYPTSFYGQLAAEELYSRLQVSPAKEASAQEVDTLLRQQPMAMLISEMAEADAADLTTVFLNHLVNKVPRAQIAAVVGLGTRLGRPDISIRAAKEALKYDMVFVQSGYPTLTVPPSTVEPALIHAFIRQESMFYPRAESAADARGLMQILPGTGKILARRLGIPFNPATSLFDSTTNMRLGSYYVTELEDRFNGTLILAIAGYNAGPSKPQLWQQQMGRPGGDLLHTLNWLEAIPYVETRNYVQRVLENYQMYRWRIGGGGTRVSMKDVLAR